MKEEKLTISDFSNDTVHGIDSKLSCSQLRKLDSGVKNGTLVTFKIKLTLCKSF